MTDLKSRFHQAAIQPRRSNRRGFTLVEMMVTIVIIGLLAAAVTLAVQSYMAQARRTIVRKDLTTLKDALETYEMTMGRYPSMQDGLDALTKKSDEFPHGLVSRSPKDPWGRPYVYLIPGRKDEPFEILCYGADGAEGGSGTSADISSSDGNDVAAK